MASVVQSILIGRGVFLSSWRRVAGLIGGLFLLAMISYAVGIFSVSGGLVWIPGHAALLGLIASFAVGVDRTGLIVAWASTYAALLGWRADHALFGTASRSIGHSLTYFLRLDGLVVLAMQAVVIGLVAYTAGIAFRHGLRVVAS